ncbi:hypothetical protein GCM10009117_13410 [Gangjinia marincola]|uniref:ZIP family metal transporter n=1 Tax=Gangjinia marincola TaxID=578463 RepID=A0ABN1MG91_9FLAO
MIILLPFAAVLIGYIIALKISTKQENSIKLLLAFSGAFLLAITMFELLPTLFNYDINQVEVFIMMGILLQIVLEFLSKGAEHGHVHNNGNNKNTIIPIFISLSIHSLIEGFPIVENQALLFAIVIHKIPIAIIVTTFLFKQKISSTKRYASLLIFALMTPLGAYLGKYSAQIEVIYPYLNAISVGIFLHVSSIILFESSNKHQFNIRKLFTIIVAIVIAYFL